MSYLPKEYVDLSTGNASSNRPAARIGRTTVYAVPTSSNAAIPFDQEQLDSDGMVTISGTTDRITCVTPGTYVVSGNIGWSANSGGTSRGVRIAHYNSSAVLQKAYVGSLHGGTGASTTPGSTASAVVSMAAGDYLRLEAYQDIGGTLNTAVALGSDHANLSAAWVGGTGAAWGNAGCRLLTTGTQTVQASTAVTWQTEDFDIDGMHAASSTDLVCVTPGVYSFSGVIGFVANASGQRGVLYSLNGVTKYLLYSDAAAAGDTVVPFAFGLKLNAGDIVQIMAQSSVSVNISNTYNQLTAVRVGYQTNPNATPRPLGIYKAASSAAYQTLADGLWEYVDFDDKLYSWMTAGDYDVSGGDDSTSNHIVAPRDGIYTVDGCCAFTSNATDHACMSRVVRRRAGVNYYPLVSGTYEDQIGNVLRCPVSGVVELQAGDQVSMQGLVSGVSLALRSNLTDGIPSANYLQITYLGPIPS